VSRLSSCRSERLIADFEGRFEAHPTCDAIPVRNRRYETANETVQAFSPLDPTVPAEGFRDPMRQATPVPLPGIARTWQGGGHVWKTAPVLQRDASEACFEGTG
jgi:hypothetical protein